MGMTLSHDVSVQQVGSGNAYRWTCRQCKSTSEVMPSGPADYEADRHRTESQVTHTGHGAYDHLGRWIS